MDATFGRRIRTEKNEPLAWTDLTNLPNEKQAFIYKRLSSHEQLKRSIYSIKAQDALIDLAQEDGYLPEQIHVEDRDLGISGTKGREDRPGLSYLIESVESDQVEAVYVVHISRIYRDQTLINAFALGELLKQHNVIIVTPYMRLNLQDKMHMRLFRMEIERAADELEVMAQRLLGPKNMKGRAGYYTGESIPPGYVVDERKQLPNGKPNPNYHRYQVYEPHAKIVRTIFNQLVIPGITPTRVARDLKKRGIGFAPFSPEYDTKAHHKTYARSKRYQDGSWIIPVSKVRSIATNPAYIGWKIWQGEVLGQDILEPIVDESTFWKVQEHFKEGPCPKKTYDPLPLAGLVYCGNHDIFQPMTYNNNQSKSFACYTCSDSDMRKGCVHIISNYLDDPVSEAVIEQIALPGLASQVLGKLSDEYEQAKDQAASYRREVKRLEKEVENLRANLTQAPLSTTQVTWVDEQIQRRLIRIRELGDLSRQPIGVLGKALADSDDISRVTSFLDNLRDIWPNQPNGLKNAFLRLLLAKVVVFSKTKTIRVKIVWRVGLEQEILIHKPNGFVRTTWSDAEIDTLRNHYPTTEREKLLQMLPGREWNSIKNKAQGLNLHRKRLKKRSCKVFSPNDDEIVRKYYSREISKKEAEELSGRDILAIRSRANRLGLLMPKATISWEWLSMGALFEQECPPRLPI
ncbi:MAG: hypothetical protein FOGNACKC_02864 [Anaerolineae bacterium]|nr:hypothetical protein [Anaerolineae bacterium]